MHAPIFVKRKRGQSSVEFALVAPFIFTFFFFTVYGGVMFMDYLNFSNHARRVAREYSLAETQREREFIERFYNKKSESTRLYDVSETIEHDEEEVTVTINFKKNIKDTLLNKIVPEDFEIRYVMKLEKIDDNQ